MGDLDYSYFGKGAFMKTIAELKRRRDGLNDEIKRREAEHELYLEAKRVADRILKREHPKMVWTPVIEWSGFQQTRGMKQAEALSTIPVRPAAKPIFETALLIGGERHGKMVRVNAPGQRVIYGEKQQLYYRMCSADGEPLIWKGMVVYTSHL